MDVFMVNVNPAYLVDHFCSSDAHVSNGTGAET